MSVAYNIGIIDDQKLFSESLKELILSFDINTKVTVLPSPSSSIYRGAFEPYDLLFIDINMPNINGFDLAETIRQRFERQKIALLSVREDKMSMDRARSMNIEGYLFKSISTDELQVALNGLLNGETYYQVSERTEKNYFKFHDGREVTLTEREKEFLEFLLLELTTKQIADKMSISIHTALGYRKSLFGKFHVDNMVGLAKYAIEYFG